MSIAAGVAFAPYTQPVYQRCLTIIQTCLQQYQTFESDPDNYEEPDRTFIVVALDLLSGLTQGLGDTIHQLVASSQPPLLHLMAVCLTVSDMISFVLASSSETKLIRYVALRAAYQTIRPRSLG